jgi:Lon protease-like protein
MISPMFPLGNVLLPGAPLPLHVFEERYRVMVAECLRGPRDFGVVLIERGSEVGGGDVRSNVGTMAGIAEATQLPDGRWVLLAMGTRRIRVHAWLEDDPYPRAELEWWPEGEPVPPAAEIRERLLPGLRRVLGLLAELGRPAAPLAIELVDDPVLAPYQVAESLPLGPVDRQRVLVAPSVAARVSLLEDLIDDEAAFLEQRLAAG